MKSAKRNYVYNLIYQIFTMIIPLITIPYLSRVLDPDGIGQISFTNSIVSYFVMFASLGFGYYAQRLVATCQDDREKQSRIFWEIVISKGFIVILVIILYFVMLFTNLINEYQIIMYVLSINVISVFFDIVFLFQGNEDFFKIIFRNILVKLIGIILIFIFIKTKDDLVLYVIFNSIVLLVSNISMWFYLPKILVPVKLKSLNIRQHFIPSLKLFVPTIAITLYRILDRTLIGVLIDGYIDIVKTLPNNMIEIISVKIAEVENGFYEQSDKIVRMVLTIVTSMGIVMIPRNSRYIELGETEKVKENILLTSRFVWFIGVPLVLGILISADIFIPWFLGENYDKVSDLIKIFSPLILIVGFSNVIGLQYLIPNKKDKVFAYAIVVGAVISILLNLILIPSMWSYGAVISSLITESVILLIMVLYTRNDLPHKKILFSSVKSLISGAVMIGTLLYIRTFLGNQLIDLIIIALTGIITYVLTLAILRDGFLKIIFNAFLYEMKLIIRRSKNE